VKLYHGTSTRHLKQILERGLLPRGGKSKGNWEHSVPSSRKHVYLTSVYAVHYAACSQRGNAYKETGESLLLLEVDTGKLLPWNMYPDEDFLYQGMKGNFPGPSKHVDMKSQTRWYRDNLAAWQGAWTDSVRSMGTCCHEGNINASAITRYAILPRSHSLRLMSDPTVGIANHGIMGMFYRALTAHVFGDPIDSIKPELPLQATQADKVKQLATIPRTGIKVEVLHK
jgi:hypothetical protein